MRLKWILIVGFVLTIAVPALAQEDDIVLLLPAGSYIADVESRYNVCVEEILKAGYGLMPQDPLIADKEFRVPGSTPLCYNEAGQRLNYYDENRQITLTPQYSSMKVAIYSLEAVNRTCVSDLVRTNPLTDYWGFFMHIRLFVPPDAHQCIIYTPDNETLYDLSHRFNVCMEAIQAVNRLKFDRLNTWMEFHGSPLNIPNDMPPCYDENGQRLNAHEREIYQPVSGQSLLDVARLYQVCMTDLLDANPFLDTYDSHLPEILFIPGTPTCDNTGTLMHVTRDEESIHSLSLLYNVCINRIYEANSQLQGVEPVVLLTPGIEISILARPDCFTLDWDNPLEMVDYVCYAEDIDLSKDYTGHEPPISPTVGTESGFCHERSNNTPVIYQNEKLTVYKLRPLDTAVTLSQCFGVDMYQLLNANAASYPWEVRPGGSWVIPEPFNHDCYLLTADDAAYYAREKQLSYKAGYLDENGIYTVNYQDTLGSIGREFGYLPSWIASVNNLPDANVIYFRQELKLPPYPSLHIIGKVAAVGGVPVLLAIAGYGLVRWRRSSKRKRKNEDS